MLPSVGRGGQELVDGEVEQDVAAVAGILEEKFEIAEKLGGVVPYESSVLEEGVLRRLGQLENLGEFGAYEQEVTGLEKVGALAGKEAEPSLEDVDLWKDEGGLGHDGR